MTNKKIKRLIVFVITLFVILLGFILFNSTKNESVNDDNYPIYQEVQIDNNITIPAIK